MTVARCLPLVFVALLLSGCGSPPADSSISTGTPTPKTTPTASVTQTPQQLAAQADVPVYPGAKFPDSVTKPPSTDDAGKIHTYLVMTTADAPAKVVAFYEKSGKYSEMKQKAGSELQGMSPKGNLVLIDLTQAGGLTTISVKSVQGS